MDVMGTEWLDKITTGNNRVQWWGGRALAARHSHRQEHRLRLPEPSWRGRAGLDQNPLSRR
ncbi:hypothetical protein [Streptomyces coffeae]|uniref:hypothetical protein n=1 Tax=Streptomyces coffeae TaxID=621382 RepID=UPI001F3C9E61|nr:hypothetical protein [Streptomyces coffeae]